MPIRTSVCVLMMAAFTIHSRLALAGSYVFTALGNPDYTTANAINDRGEVAGSLESFTDGKLEGFIYAHGTYTYVKSDPQSNILDAINAKGVTAGLSGTAGAFVYRPITKETHAIKAASGDYVSPAGINASREVVGTMNKAGTTLYTAFLHSHGQTASINPPGAVRSSAVAINDAGVLVGNYGVSNATDEVHGFTYTGGTDGKGTFATFDPPSSVAAYPLVITNGGIIVGYYCNNGCHDGFVLQNGKYTIISYPGTNETVATGIGPDGEIAGNFTDSSANWHGFILRNGTYFRIDAPQAVQTYITAINAQGSIIGSYTIPDPGSRSGTGYAFVATCPKGQAPCTQ